MKPSPIRRLSSFFSPSSPATRKGGPGQAAARRALVEPLEGRQLLTTLPTGFAEAQVATGFVSPTAMTVAPDGRIFVAVQSGELYVVKNNQKLDEPFLTVPTEAFEERGFGGVELDPNFESNGYVYVYYTAHEPTIHNRVSRFTADPANPDRALPGSETIIYEVQSANGAGYHQGGALHFGPDGKLYVAVGEHGGTVRAQQMTNPFGKMLRINPDGSIPSDNPFLAETTGANQAIWAIGLRNPFTFAFQPGTGKMYINDVGQNLWEEINLGAPGANYGWPEAEGPSTDPRFASPAYAYPHPDMKAITGGDFYNPPTTQFPAGYTGSYFFGDLDRRWIKRIDPATNARADFAASIPGEPVDIDVAADGSLLYLARPIDAPRPGGVYRITYSSTGAPVIGSHPQNRTVVAGQSASFTVTASGAEPLTYQWQRNGTNIDGATGPTYVLDPATTADTGAQFRVVVSNGAGTVTSNAATLTVAEGGAPTATITSPAPGTLFSAGDTISYGGTATDAEDGTLAPGAFTWQVDYITGAIVRPLIAPTTGSRTGSFTIPRLTPYTGTDVAYRVTLTVRDSAGLTHTTSHDLAPRTATVTVASNVPGARLSLNGSPMTSPTFTGVVGFERLLGAPPTQTVNGVNYEFVSWSDAGGAEHTIQTPATDTTYTAVYRALDDGSGNPETSPDLTVALAQALPAAAVTGSKWRTRVRITNSGQTPVSGAADLGLYLSNDAYLHPDDTPVATLPRNLRLRPGASKTITLPFTFPQTITAGNYHLLAWADAAKAVPERNEPNNVGASGGQVALAEAQRDFSVSVSQMTVTPGIRPRGSATLLLRYDGNVPAAGPLAIELRASADTTLDDADTSLATITRRVRMRPGQTKLIRLRFLPAGLGSGTYYVTAAVDTAAAFSETNETNNTATSATTFTA